MKRPSEIQSLTQDFTYAGKGLRRRNEPRIFDEMNFDAGNI